MADAAVLLRHERAGKFQNGGNFPEARYESRLPAPLR